MTEHHDEEVDGVLRQAIHELRELPPLDEAAIANIVATARTTPQETRGGIRNAGYNVAARWLRPAAIAAGLVLFAGVGGYALRDRLATRDQVAARETTSPTSTVGEPGSHVLAAAPTPTEGERPVATQFVLDAPSAQSVSLVGDFNDWDARSTPLARDPQTGLWTLTLPVTPGRHVYAYIVDGQRWTLDPRAPKEADADFGRPGSVILVEER